MAPFDSLGNDSLVTGGFPQVGVPQPAHQPTASMPVASVPHPQAPPPGAPTPPQKGRKFALKGAKAKDAKNGTKKDAQKKSGALSVIGNILFYGALVLMIVAAGAFALSDNPEKSIFGYRYYWVRSASMEPDLPVGSMMIVEMIPPEEVEIGDDITFSVSSGGGEDYVTHRVVDIIEGASGSAGPQFVTRGINNPQNDPNPRPPESVIGRVIWDVPHVGTVMAALQANLIIVVVLLVLFVVLSFFIRRALESRAAEKRELERKQELMQQAQQQVKPGMPPQPGAQQPGAQQPGMPPGSPPSGAPPSHPPVPGMMPSPQPGTSAFYSPQTPPVSPYPQGMPPHGR